MEIEGHAPGVFSNTKEETEGRMKSFTKAEIPSDSNMILLISIYSKVPGK